ncbi:MAG: hypothetical protein H0U98_16570 [Alphaproteobacteria bacterium]|nr:hypothetical protein [Alphaproteobacteria bacterium]
MMRSLPGIAGGAFLILGMALARAEPAPSGAADPEAITCNAPELVAASKERGWPVCVQNDMVGTSLANAPVMDRPSGEGDPGAITCRARQELTGTRVMGPETCAYNSFWAKLAVDGCVLSPGSRTILRLGTTKVLRPLACAHIQGRNGTMPPTFF